MSSVSARSSNAPVHVGHKHLHLPDEEPAAAIAYAPVRQATHNRKRDQLDKLIAAHAIALDVTLVTNNLKDFAVYPGVRLENWLD